MYLTRNQAWVYAHRGFESHPLRHLIQKPGFAQRTAGFFVYADGVGFEPTVMNK